MQKRPCIPCIPWLKNEKNIPAGANGLVQFRGFRGKYKLSWKNPAGREQSCEMKLE
jgi:hypothetical protein